MDELILLRSTATNNLMGNGLQIGLTFIEQIYCAPYSLLTKISKKNCLFTMQGQNYVHNFSNK